MGKLVSVLLIAFGMQVAQASNDVEAFDLSPEQMMSIEQQLDEMELEQEFEEENAAVGPLKWRCFAENRWQELFRATHKKRRVAMRRALNRCYRYSRRCWRAGCERIVRIPF